MSLRLSFPCPACGSAVQMNTKDLREFEIVGKDNIIQWSDFMHEGELPTPDIEVWTRSDEMPHVGTKRFVKAAYPFNQQVGERFWTLFMPALSELNGWDSHPGEIEQSGMVECTFLQVISQNEKEAWILVRVEQFLLLDLVSNRFEPKPNVNILKNFKPFEPLNVNVFGKWIYAVGSLQGNIGAWALIQKNDNNVRMILYGEWEFLSVIAR